MNRRLVLAILLAAAVAPYFINLGATSIIDANEAFYSETPREMLESGDYINSSFNYQPRFNKPPLSYWVVAGFYHAFGVSLGAARLPIALGTLVVCATAFLIGRAAFSIEAGLLAALTLAATPRMLLFSRRIIIDVYTAMFLGLVLLCFVGAEADPPRRRRWLAAMYAAAGLGLMTKGPVAVVLPALVLGVYLVLSGRLHTIARLMLPTGALIMAVIVVPYYAALYAQHGWEYITTFIVRENVARYAEGVGAPSRGPLFYLPVLFADLYFPWSLVLPAAFALVPWKGVAAGKGWRRLVSGGTTAEPVPQGHLRLLLGLWVVLIVGFFSFSKGQQDLYILPFIAAGAPLAGGALSAWTAGTLQGGVGRLTRWGVAVAAAALGLIGVLVAWFLGGTAEPVHVAGAGPAGVIVALGAATALMWLFRRRPFAAVAMLAATIIVAQWVLVIWALPDFERYKPVPQLARVVREMAGPGAAVGIYKVPTPSLVFYLQRPVPQMFGEAELQAFLNGHAEAYCVMTDDDFEAVKGRLTVPVRVVARAPRFEARLSDFLNRSALPDLLLVTTRP